MLNTMHEQMLCKTCVRSWLSLPMVLTQVASLPDLRERNLGDLTVGAGRALVGILKSYKCIVLCLTNWLRTLRE